MHVALDDLPDFKLRNPFFGQLQDQQVSEKFMRGFPFLSVWRFSRHRTVFLVFPFRYSLSTLGAAFSQSHEFDPNSIAARAEQFCDQFGLEASPVKQSDLLSLLQPACGGDDEDSQYLV